MPWGECRLPRGPVSPELGAELKRLTGGRPRWLSRLSPVPWVARSLALLSTKAIVHADRSLCEQIALIVSRENSCRYCYGVQRALFKIIGQRERDIDALERSFDLGELKANHRVVLEMARKLARAESRPSPGELQALADKEGQEALAEIVFVVAGVGYSNRVATFLLLPPETQVEQLGRRSWPPVRWLAARRLMRRHAVAPLTDAGHGPCAPALELLVGLPCGSSLAEVVAEAFASPHLPTRTKLLMMAVVGRALGCAIADEETRRALVAEGVSAEERERIVDHLGERSVDPRESALLRFARDSIRYRYDAIQRTMEQLESMLSTEELVEAVGIASLANLVCRLTVLAGAC